MHRLRPARAKKRRAVSALHVRTDGLTVRQVQADLKIVRACTGTDQRLGVRAEQRKPGWRVAARAQTEITFAYAGNLSGKVPGRNAELLAPINQHECEGRGSFS